MTTDYPHPGDLDDEDDPDHDHNHTEPDDPEDIEEKEDYYRDTDYTPSNIAEPYPYH